MTPRRQWLKAWGAGALVLAWPAWAQSSDELFRAVHQDSASTVRRLLAAGVNPNARNEKGNPALHVALQEGALQAAQALLADARLQPELRNSNDESALMLAALKGHLDIAQRLFSLGAHVNKPGWAALHYAATGGHLALMDWLLEEHAFIDAQSPNGTTPLMMAAMYGTPEAVKLLIQAGADLKMRNDKGMTALDFAQSANRQNALELLLEAHRRSQRGPTGQW